MLVWGCVLQRCNHMSAWAKQSCPQLFSSLAVDTSISCERQGRRKSESPQVPEPPAVLVGLLQAQHLIVPMRSTSALREAALVDPSRL